MPELPEVESVRRQLHPLLVGHRITAAWRDDHPHARFHDVDQAAGRCVLGLTRRGKYLIAALGEPDREPSAELVLHLGMSGSLHARPHGAADLPHVRARFDLDDGTTLHLRDPRRFGRVSVVSPGRYEPVVPTLARLGPDAVSPAFTTTHLAQGLASSRAPVKSRLLDQRLVAGIGNIYADEALWRARIHPGSRRVGAERAARLHAGIDAVLRAAIEREGTTFRDHRMVNGASGRYATMLDVYGKHGLPCRRCGTTLRRITVAQRGTTYCPRCQRA